MSYKHTDIRVLNELEHIKLNPGMYIGATDNPIHLVEEAFDNALDEVLAGYAKNVAITINTKEGIITVLDDGRGIPITKDIPVVVSTKIFSGAKFQDKKTAYEISCLVGRTRILLLDGFYVSIEEMTKNPDKEYWGLSSTLDGKWEATKFLKPQITGYTKNLIRVYIDNDKFEECTPEHLWLMKDGTYKQAKDLKENDSLMPCYYKKDKNGYIVVRSNNTTLYKRDIEFERRKFIHLHKIVYESLNGKIPYDCCIHHKDLTRNNNYPDNLQLINKIEHLNLHGDIGRKAGLINADGLVRYNRSEKGRKKSREIGLKYGSIGLVSYSKSQRNRDDKKERMKFYNSIPGIQNELQKCKILKYTKTLLLNNIEINEENWKKFAPYSTTKFSRILNYFSTYEEFLRQSLDYPYYYNDFQETNSSIMIKKRIFSILNKIEKENIDLNIDSYNQMRGLYDPKIKSINKYFGSFKELISEFMKNHKVIKIEEIILEKEIPVYDVFAPRNSNFVLSSGVIVHNSGMHGVGLVSVNALSDWYEVEVYRNNKHGYYRFEDANLSKKEVKSFKGEKPYSTKIRFKPSQKIFENVIPDFDRIRRRLLTAAAELSDDNSFVLLIDDNEKEVFNLSLENYFKKTCMNSDELTDTVYLKSSISPEKFDVMFSYSNNGNISPRVFSSVNLLPVNEGGTHVNCFFEMLRDFFVVKAKKLDYKFQPQDCLCYLRCYLMLSLKQPKFSGQTKDKLTSRKSYLEKMVKILRNQLEDYFQDHPDYLEILLEKFQDYRRRMDMKKMRSSSNGKRVSTKFTKLRDCTNRNGELFIVEGDSAAGSVIQCRDPKNHAILPLKGKIPNVVNTKDILKNKEVEEIIKAIGAGVGPDFDISKMRYDKIICLADADPDGGHIASLVTMVLAILTPDIIKNKKFYIAETPLFVINESKSFIPLWSDKEVEEAQKNKRNITRCKGIGEYNPSQLKKIVIDVDNRKLVQVEFSKDLKKLITLFSDVGAKRELLQNIDI